MQNKKKHGSLIPSQKLQEGLYTTMIKKIPFDTHISIVIEKSIIEQRDFDIISKSCIGMNLHLLTKLIWFNCCTFFSLKKQIHTRTNYIPLSNFSSNLYSLTCVQLNITSSSRS